MAAEATYLVTADQGISTSTGRHAKGETVWLSDVEDEPGSSTRLERLGLIVATGAASTPPKGRGSDGVPDWVDAAYYVGTEPQVVGDLSLPEARTAAFGTPAPSAVDDALTDALAESPAAASAADLGPDADAAGVVTFPAPAVIRFARDHPARIADLVTAEQGKPKPRASLVKSLRGLAKKEPAAT